MLYDLGYKSAVVGGASTVGALRGILPLSIGRALTKSLESVHIVFAVPALVFAVMANDDKFDAVIVERSKKLLDVGRRHGDVAPLFSTPRMIPLSRSCA